MGQQSDNTAVNIMSTVLGEEAVNQFAQRNDMPNTDILENLTTARDIGIFFRRLWNQQIVDQENRDEILDYLTNTIYEDWIPAALPEGTKVAHKYGREVHVINDAGIVFGSKPYVLVVMTQGIVESEAEDVFPEIVKLVHARINSAL
jgi:beta-lactamase class A